MCVYAELESLTEHVLGPLFSASLTLLGFRFLYGGIVGQDIRSASVEDKDVSAAVEVSGQS